MIEKTAIKNERPGIMLAPGLRPAGESTEAEARADEKIEEPTPVKA